MGRHSPSPFDTVQVSASDSAVEVTMTGSLSSTGTDCAEVKCVVDLDVIAKMARRV